MFVGVGSASDFPEPEPPVVGLMRRMRTQDDEVPFGLEIEDGLGAVRSDDRPGWHRRRVVQRPGGREPGEHEETVNAWTRGLMALMYVTVRAADCDSPATMSRLGWSPCKGSTPLPPHDRAGDLGEHVV